MVSANARFPLDDGSVVDVSAGRKGAKGVAVDAVPVEQFFQSFVLCWQMQASGRSHRLRVSDGGGQWRDGCELIAADARMWMYAGDFDCIDRLESRCQGIWPGCRGPYTEIRVDLTYISGPFIAPTFNFHAESRYGR